MKTFYNAAILWISYFSWEMGERFNIFHPVNSPVGSLLSFIASGTLLVHLFLLKNVLKWKSKEKIMWLVGLIPVIWNWTNRYFDILPMPR